MATYRPRLNDDEIDSLRQALSAAIGSWSQDVPLAKTAIEVDGINYKHAEARRLYIKLCDLQGEGRMARLLTARWAAAFDRLVDAWRLPATPTSTP